MSLTKNAAVALALLLPVPPAALAHTVWLEDTGSGAFELQYGGHEGRVEPYDAAKLKDLKAFDGNGRPVPVQRQDAAGKVRVRLAGASVATASFDNGYWSRTAEGRSVNQPMQAVPGAVDGVHAIKFHKRILAWSPAARTVFGQPFELVPQTTVAPVAGQPLRIQVLVDGRPAAGIWLAFGEEGKLARSDAQGIATLAPRTGRNRIWAGQRLPVAGDPATTQRSVEYSLVFDAA